MCRNYDYDLLPDGQRAGVTERQVVPDSPSGFSVARIDWFYDQLGRLTREAYEFVAVTFEDAGVGIPKQHLRDIFDPFFTSNQAAKGTGLGLSVSLGIIQEHGGDIHVQSEVGKGSVFTVLLPVAKVPAEIGNVP